MALLDDLRRLTRRFSRHNPTGDQPGQNPPELGTAPTAMPFGSMEMPGEASIASMSPQDLLAWENRGIPNIDRPTDLAETREDERQDLTTSLNFPLHWTSARLSWDYLFDFSIACELLAPRPDDLVLDFAAGSCWATELLSRLAVRTVSLDLSLEMMRRGRQRLAFDSR